ncbi:FadR/GntR family transcriptional regulator [Nocardiopsis ansamitocini]|nr:FCD domain-containing protein [Nocardiopsis ansamitocini]
MPEEPWGGARLSPIVQVRAHEAIVKQLREEILAGRLHPGSRLPGERQLSEAFGVSRASVREALRVMEALEVVQVSRGARSGSGLVISTEPGEALSTLLSFGVALGHFSMRDVVQMRALLERSSAQSVIEHLTDERREYLQGLVDAMRDGELTREQFHTLDTDFHVYLVETGGNGLVAHLMHALRDSIQRQMMERFEREDWTTLSSQLADEHQALLDAVVEKDAERARSIIDAHIADFYDAWVSSMDEKREAE